MKRYNGQTPSLWEGFECQLLARCYPRLFGPGPKGQPLTEKSEKIEIASKEP
jgi:hypothetical protein